MSTIHLRIAAFALTLLAAAPALAAPAATTTSATSITSSSAVLNGTGTPNGAATSGWFRYSTTNPGTCDDLFGNRLPATGGTDLGSGASAVAYSITATGLSSGTTYYFCAIVSNTTGTAFGSVLSFTIPGPPVVTTSATSALTATTATLNGAANPVGASTTGWFRYGTANPGTCSDTYGTRAPSSGGTSLGSGASSTPYTQNITGLTPGTLYYVCALASNTYGTTFGGVLTFTTLAAAPSVTTNNPSVLTGTTATFNGTANPGGADATGWFRYATTSPGTCNDTFGTRTPAADGSSLGSGNNSVAFSQAVTGLTAGVTYYYCAIAANSVATSTGSVVSFTTPLPPVATTTAATSVTSSSAVLNGSGIPNNAAASGWFRYAATDPGTCNDTFGSRAPTSGSTSLGSGTTSQTFSQTISSLSSGVTYFYCAIVLNTEGTSFGAVLTLRTQGPPSVATAAATAITASSVTLNAAANPSGATTTGWFRYATTSPGTCNDSFGTRAPSSGGASLGSGLSDVNYTQGLSSLTPGTTYYFCALSSNSFGTAYGSVLSFTTSVAAPNVSTGSPSPLLGTTATLQASVNPGGAATTGWFRYSTVSPGTCNDTFGTRAPASGGTALGSGTNSVSLSQAVTGLTAGTNYYVCAIASNSVATTLGNVTTFTTPLPPSATTMAATSIGDTYAYLNGSGIPNGAAVTGWFRYATTDPGSCDDVFGSRVPASGGTSLGSGYAGQSFQQYITGLSAGSTYYFCAIASSSEGTAFGSVLTFRTQGPPNTLTTAATSIGTTSATLNGSVTPNGATTTGWIRYATTSPGTCNDSFGTRLPSSGGSSLGAGSAPVALAQSTSSLLPGTKYYYCALASNSLGASYGSVLSFTTNTAAPTVSTGSPSPLRGTTATLQAAVNPGGADTTGWFRYALTSPGTCNDTFGTRAPAADGAALGWGTSSVALTQAITGLTAGATYYFCAIASNAVGTTFGSVVAFTTPLPPATTTTAATSIGDTYAYLNGSGIPNGSAMTGWFRYSATDPGACDDSFGSRVPATSGTSLGSGYSSQSFSQYISGLSSGATYYFCAIGSSSEGTSFGAVFTFRTQGSPATTTVAASNIGANSVTLNGSSNPSGATTTGWFRYSTTNPTTCNDTFGTRLPSSGGTSLGAGGTAVPYAQSLSSLLPGTTYFFCALASNSLGSSYGSVLSFTTLTAAPTVTTGSPSPLTGTAATLQASSNPGGAATTGWFRYATVSPGSCNDTFGTRAPATGAITVGSGTSNTSFTQAVTGLTAGTTYYVCALATNAVGTTFGSPVSFTTPLPATVTTTPATSVGDTYAYLNGSAIPNGAATTGWFRYAATDPGTCDDTFGSRVPTPTGGSSLGSGYSSQSFSQYISGLSSGATYFYCAIVSSTEGTVFGAVFSFRTQGPPSATTVAASNVTATSATLNGTVNPSGATSTGWFRYSTTSPGNCNDTFGTRLPSSGGASLGSGTSSVNYAQNLSSLLPGTTYYFCALSSNSLGASYGAVLSFVTNTAAPTVTTNSPSPLTGTTARLSASINPGGAATTVWFRYATVSPGSCNDTFGTRAPATGAVDVAAGTTTVTATQATTGLTAGGTYYVCAIASNAVGTVLGGIVAFTTPLPPTATTTAATSVGDSYAYLNGSSIPNGAASTGWFRYATTDPGDCDDTFGSRAPTTGGSSLGSSYSSQSFSQYISTLSPGTTYFYCAIVSSAEGISFGAVMTLRTQGSPTAVTTAASSIAAKTATLNGTANPNGAAATGWFRYSSTNPGICNDTFGTRIPTSGGTSLGTGTAAAPFSQNLSSLVPATTYFYCALASNTYGTAVGTVLSFTTLTAAPTVTTNSPSTLTSSGATLSATVNPGGEASLGWFRYATVSPGTCNDTFGTRAPASDAVAITASASNQTVSQAVTGLTAGTTYYVCAFASNSVGVTFGSVVSFTVPLAPSVASLAATPITSTTATLNGSGNPNGYTTTGWFRYSTTNPGSCNDTFGTRAPATNGTSLGAGSSAIAFSQAITGLTPGTLYYSCAIALSPIALVFGEVLTFTTPAIQPVATTVAASGIAPDSATLNATGNPGGGASTGWFRYSTTNPGSCNDTFGTRTPTTGGTDLGSGNSGISFTANLTGLTTSTTYFFCAIVSNSVGTVFGSVLSFNTAVPIVTTLAATAVANSSVTLNGSANPNGTTATGWFRYSTTNPGSCNDSFGTRTPTSSGTALGAGSTAVPYTQGVTGLMPATTYYFCALASNTIGTNVGTVLSFKTASSPSVTTDPASGLAGTGVATLNGTAIPNGATSTGWFRYGTVSPGTCNDSFGTRAPVSGGASLGSGTTAVSWTQGISGLTPGVTYFFCALASNGYGTTTGAVDSFTMPSATPMVTTGAATLVTGTTAQLGGTANPNGDVTTAWFRYATSNPGACTDSFGTRVPVSGGTDLGAGTSAASFTEALTGLLPGTTYYFCALASNSSGAAVGQIASFTTAPLPITTTTAATSIGDTSATLNGSANPNGTATSGWFRYSTSNPGSCNDTFGTRMPFSSGTALGAGSTAATFSQAITGLTPATTYFFCALALNTGGQSMGNVLSFTTTSPPTVSTAAATLVTSGTATLNGFATPNGASTTGWFRYSATNPITCNDTFGTRTPFSGGADAGSGTSAVSYSQSINGLTPGTTYFFCALASNVSGTALGSVLSFTTGTSGPSVVTNATTSVTGITATLNGSASPGGATTSGWFRYASVNPGTCNDTFGTRAPGSGGTSLGSGVAFVDYTQALTGLIPGTTYYGCAIASNTSGTSFGTIVSFTTPGPPTVVTSAATAVADTSATLNGSANPNGSSTIGWFRYATVDPGACNDTFGTRAPTSSGDGLGASPGAASYSRSVSGLTAGTTYYFCALASNQGGLSVGSVLSFKTTAPPTVTTAAASAVAAGTVTLNGSANPNGATTSGWFRYSATDPGTCSDSFGTRAPTSSGSPLGAGAVAAGYSQDLTGLTPGTTYFYCALASNASGTGLGSVLTFTTAIVAPTVVTNGPIAATGTTATLSGSATPGGAAATGWFRYSTTNPGTCSDSFGTRAPSASGTALAAGTSSVDFTQAITGLTPGTTYYICALASNTAGLGTGSVISFTTPTPPAVNTTAATSIALSSAVLNGSSNPNGSSAIGWFRYSSTDPGSCNDTFGTRAPTTSGNALGSGSTAGAFSLGVSGLAPNTTYYFCALASNAGGAAMGAVLSFRTPAAPTVTTGTATVVTSTSASLNGHANPNGTDATGWFRYAATNPGTCSDTFGVRVPASAGSTLGNGNVTVDYTQSLTGLAPGTTYYFCALAANTLGTSVGDVQSFTTSAALPVVTTLAASNFGAGSAVLNATANPGGGATAGWFRYDTTNPGACNNAFGTRAPTNGIDLGSGQSSAPFSQSLSGLQAGTTYFFCALASNSSGTASGTVLSFTTPALPTVATNAASSVADTFATLNGQASPNGTSATGWFRYGSTSPGTCNDTFGTRTADSTLGAGSTAASFSQVVTGLQPNTVYFFCALASNTAGVSFGTLSSFRTPDAPDATTGTPTLVTATSATLNGSATPNGALSTGWFRYDTTDPGTCNDTFGTRSSSATLGSGTNAVAFSQVLTGLLPGTTYYFCALASNDYGTGVGAVSSFTTSALPPTVNTGAAVFLSGTSVQLNGTAVPNGDAAMGWFRYGTLNPGACSDAFGTRAPTDGGTPLGSANAGVAFREIVSSLTPGTTYYFCALATNAAGTSFGQVQSFTTLPLPTVTTLAATAIGPSVATLNGSGNPSGTATIGWFRYDTVDPGTCDDTFGLRVPTSSGTSLGTGTSAVAWTKALNGLQPNTTYYYCALVANAAGLATGSVLSFRTPDAPSVTTGSATLVTANAATLNGSATPNGSATTGWFRYDTTDPGVCNDTFGTRSSIGSDAVLDAGTTAVSFAQPLAGLAPGTTYWFCAIASNANGKTFGGIVSFTTSIVPPAVTTTGATLLDGTTVQLLGSATPNGDVTTAWFRYGTLNPGTCNDVFGTRAPTAGGTTIATGSTDGSFSQTVDQLLPGTTYYYCAIAANGAGKTYGQVLSIDTLPQPTVTTLPATAVATTVATLNGVSTPNGAATTGWFRYSRTNPTNCNDSFGTRAPASGGVQLGAGTSSVDYAQVLSGLSPGTTYYYCALVTNAGGLAFGEVQSFTTTVNSGPPVVLTSPATALTSISANLNGTVDPNFSATVAWFRYSPTSPGTCNDSFGTRQPNAEGTSVPATSGTIAYAETVSGLTAGTTYYFCAIAANSLGTRFGVLRTFTTTPIAPTITTLAPTNVGTDAATLNGSVVANGDSTTAWFRYGTTNPGTCSNSFGTRAPSLGLDVGAGTAVTPYNTSLSGLSPGTTYYFCAIAANARGTSTGEMLSFTTGAPPPAVVTGEAMTITAEGATLAGTADANGTPTMVWFRYGQTEPESCSDFFGQRFPATGGTTIDPSGTGVPFSETLTGLDANTTWYYCAAASNAGGAVFGAIRSFQTLAAPPSVRSIGGAAGNDGAFILSGAANPHGMEAIGWFRYGSNNPGTCSETFGARTGEAKDTNLGSGSAEVSFSAPITGLAGGTYYFCAVAQNELGTTYGEVLSFDAPASPDPVRPSGCGCGPGGSVSSLVWLVPLVLLGMRRRRRMV